MDNQEEIFNLTEATCFDDEDLLKGVFSIEYSTIQKEQKKYLSLQAKLNSHKKKQKNPAYTENTFRVNKPKLFYLNHCRKRQFTCITIYCVIQETLIQRNL